MNNKFVKFISIKEKLKENRWRKILSKDFIQLFVSLNYLSICMWLSVIDSDDIVYYRLTFSIHF